MPANFSFPSQVARTIGLKGEQSLNSQPLLANRLLASCSIRKD